MSIFVAFSYKIANARFYRYVQLNLSCMIQHRYCRRNGLTSAQYAENSKWFHCTRSIRCKYMTIAKGANQNSCTQANLRQLLLLNLLSKKLSSHGYCQRRRTSLLSHLFCQETLEHSFVLNNHAHQRQKSIIVHAQYTATVCVHSNEIHRKFSGSIVQARANKKHHISKMEQTICLKFGATLALT